MSIPSKKDPVLDHLLEVLTGRSTAIVNDECSSCKKPATEFKDALSRKEYTISGLCQVCQDKVFG